MPLKFLRCMWLSQNKQRTQVRNKFLKVRDFRLQPRNSWELRSSGYAASSSISILDACRYLLFIWACVSYKWKCDWSFGYSLNEKREVSIVFDRMYLSFILRNLNVSRRKNRVKANNSTWKLTKKPCCVYGSSECDLSFEFSLNDMVN
jgi:hypothetical protein